MSQEQRNELISVVMPVHNALPHLDEAVSSILNQSYAHFEFVIFDDASTDGSTERLEEWAERDARIRLIKGRTNLGPASSSNQVIRYATGRLIARMDADDVSVPERLERQVEVFQKRPDVGLVGSLCEVIDSTGRHVRGPELWRLTRKSWSAPFPHGSTMVRKDVFDAVGGYRDQCEFWEDLDFVLRVAQQAKIVVMIDPLYFYRQSSTSTRIVSDQLRVERAIDRRYRFLSRIQEGNRYDGGVSNPPSSADYRVDPRVFISLGSLVLWSNGRPKLVRRLLHRGRLALDTPTLTALLWTLWARASPSTLRQAMQLVSRVRNATARKPAAEDRFVEWFTPAAPKLSQEAELRRTGVTHARKAR